MKIPHSLLIPLRAPALLCLVLILASAGFLFSQQAALEQARATRLRHQQSLRQLAETQEQREQHREQQAIAEESFQRLRAAGLADAPRPAVWMQRLHDIREALDIPELRYQPLSEFTRPPQARPPVWQATPLQLSLNLRHELDLIHLLERLLAQTDTLVVPRSCRLTRHPEQAGLTATCQTEWYTIRMPLPDATP